MTIAELCARWLEATEHRVAVTVNRFLGPM
jgi:hypothetical protein